MDGKLLLVTSILVHHPSRHFGSFAAHRAHGYVTRLADAPLFCDQRVTADNTRIVVLTDDRQLANASYRHTEFVLVPPSPDAMETNSYRFLCALEHLDSRKDWTHAHLIDASDVVPLRRPPTDANQLVVGVDTAKVWLQRLATAQHYAPSAALRGMMANRSAIMYNAGILGGSADRILEVLRALRHRIKAAPMVNDMIHLNEVLLHHHRAPLTLGYPHGPVHLPFWGTPAGCANEACRHEFLRTTMGRYWFGHKIPGTWVGILRTGLCGEWAERKYLA